jgi:DNA-binding CsgD family transcriptional regulator
MVASFKGGSSIKEIAAELRLSPWTVAPWLRSAGIETRARGERHGQSKLTKEMADEIKRRLADGESQLSIARALGISTHPIYLIVKGKAWK